MTYNKGFTLIEILVVVAVITVIIAFGSVIDLNAFKTDTLSGEESRIISILQKARSRSMANMYNTTHGVCYIAPDYVIFQGSTCASGDSIPANTNIASNPGSTFPTFVFSRLTGNTTAGTIHITDGINSKDITINNEGTINW